jgi:hypothetical protein
MPDSKNNNNLIHEHDQSLSLINLLTDRLVFLGVL